MPGLPVRDGGTEGRRVGGSPVGSFESKGEHSVSSCRTGAERARRAYTKALRAPPDAPEKGRELPVWVIPGSGYFDSSALAARKHRLRVALDFFPLTELPKTRAAADEHDLTQQNARAAIGPASSELGAELTRLEMAFTD